MLGSVEFDAVRETTWFRELLSAEPSEIADTMDEPEQPEGFIKSKRADEPGQSDRSNSSEPDRMEAAESPEVAGETHSTTGPQQSKPSEVSLEPRESETAKVPDVSRDHEAPPPPGDPEEIPSIEDRRLLLQARMATGTERSRLLSKAEKRFRAVETARPGYGLFSLARISILRGDEDAARRWLTRWRKLNAPPEAEQVFRTTDFDPVRDRAWFRELVGAGEREASRLD